MLTDLASALGICAAYVASVYAASSDNSRRNENPVIVKRLVVSGAVSALLGIWPLISKRDSKNSLFSVSALQHFFAVNSTQQRHDFVDSVLMQRGGVAAKLVLTLFAGVVVEWTLNIVARIKGRLLPRSGEPRPLPLPQRPLSSAIQTLRDCVAAPLAEELVFRGAIHQCCFRDGSNPLLASSAVARVILSAIIFSVAHVHHAVSFAVAPDDKTNSSTSSLLSRLRFDKNRAIQQAIPPLLFGIVSGIFVELDVGLLPIAAAHGFCNLVGPPMWQATVLGDHVVEEEILAPIFLRCCADDEDREKKRRLLGKLFLVMHVVCVVLFVRGVYKSS